MKFLLSSLILSIGLAVFMALATNPLAADIVVFDLQTVTPLTQTDPLLGPVGLGDALDEGAPFTATFAGVTFVASATTNFGDLTAEFNATNGGSGVNTGGGGNPIGDSASGIDIGEELTFTLTFDPALFDVALEEVDFGGLNGDDDTATLAIAGGTPTVFTSDLDLTATPFSLSSGDTLVFTNTSVSTDGFVFPDFDPQFDINSISLHIKPLAVVPEPSSLAMLGLGSLVLLGRRKRRF